MVSEFWCMTSLSLPHYLADSKRSVLHLVQLLACFGFFRNVQRLVKQLFEGPEPEPAAGCSVSFTLMKHSAH